MSLASDKKLAEDLLGTSIDMVYARNEEIRALRTQRDELLKALKAIIDEGWSYESEYDGQMFEHCKGCSYQTPYGKGEHTSDCPYIKAEALISYPAPTNGAVVNARLIDAAPHLLKALQKVMADDDWTEMLSDETVEACRSAIAKVTLSTERSAP